MNFGFFLCGFAFSIPAAAIAYPLFDGKGIEDTFWILFGFAAILGFPWNVGLSLISVPAILVLSLQTYIWAAFGYMVIGAHMNGAWIAKKIIGSSRSPSAAPHGAVATAFRLLLIGALAPAVAHLIIMAADMRMLWFTAIDRYPVMAIATFLALLPVHRLFAARLQSPLGQLPIVVVAGLVAGYVVLLCRLSWRMVVPESFVSSAALGYAGAGLLVALCCWTLYNWGPLQVASLRTDAA